ncbi:MAG: TonB-dependent receptor [Acidobacteriales bacterium]|nr:TonB-dependent receptor [Terriglobales bacterium]
MRSGLQVNQVVTGAQLPPDAGSPTYAAYASTGAPVFDIVSYSTPNDSGGGAPQNAYNMVHRVDFNLTDKTTMYGRYALFSQNEFAGFVNNSPYAGYDTGQNTHNQNVLLSVTHIFSPNVVGDTKLNFNRLSNVQPLSAQQPVQPSLYFNFNFDAAVAGQTTCLPGYACTAPGASLPFGGPQNVGEVAQSLNWNKGQHGFIFGGEYIYTQDNRTFGAYENAVEAVTPRGGGTVPDGLENLLNGNAGWFQVAIDPQGKFPCQKDATGAYIQTPACTVNLPTSQPNFSRSNRFNDMAFFGQDNWKIRPRLTLNLGLRWEYYGVQHNVDPKLDSNFVLGSGGSLQDRIRNGQVFPVSSTAGVPSSPVGGLWHKNLHNFAPRIGFAYDVFGDGKTSLRGGYGIAYERNFGNVTFNVIQNPPAQFNAIFQSPAQPLYSDNLGPFAGTGTFRLPNASLRYVRQDIPTSYSQNWNLSLERELMRNTVLALDYTGAHTIHQYSLENMNQSAWGVIYEGTDPFVDNPFDRLNRQYSNMNTRGFGGFSYYEALNTRFSSANLFNQGLTFTVNYTWSHTIDNLSSTFSASGGESPQTISLGLLDPFQPALDKGNADFDVRHRVAMSAVWAVPYAKDTHGFVRQVLDGWEFAPILIARTGYPFSVFDSNASIGDTVFARYFIPQGTTIPLTGSTATNAGNYLAPDQFAYMRLPASATYFNPLLASAGVIDGEVPTCDTTINSLGDPVSTGQNCQWPANMTRRNAFRGPGVYNINLAISKTFPITERFRIQFRGEAYNLLNHSNYYIQSAPNQDAGASGCSATLNPGACSSFPIVGAQGVIPIAGVPNERRFIQFALKLLF